MDTKKSLVSYAIMRDFHEKNNKISMAYSPFIENVIATYQYQFSDITTIVKDASTLSGLKIPHLIVKGILKELEKMGKIETKDDCQYAKCIDDKKKATYSDLLIIKETNNKILIDAMRTFIEIEAADAEMYEILSKFIYICLEEFDVIDGSFNGKDLLNPVFIQIANFVEKIKSSNALLYRYFQEIYYGYMLSTIVDPAEIQKYERTLKTTRIYLDSNFILRIIGLQSEVDERASMEVVELLKRFAFPLLTTNEIIEEVRSVIYGVIKKIEHGLEDVKIPEIRLSYVDGVLGAVLRKKMSIGTIENKYRNIEDELIKMGVIIDRSASIEKIVFDNYGFQKLVELKEKKYKNRNRFEELEYYEETEDDTHNEIPKKVKERIIKNATIDMQIIEFISRQRSGYKVHHFDDAKAVFLTCDKLLFRFNKRKRNKFEIPEVMLEDALINMLWLYNPTLAGTDVEISRIIRIYQASTIIEFNTLNGFYKKLSKIAEENPSKKDVIAMLSTNSLTNIIIREGKRAKTGISYDEYLDKIIKEALAKKTNIFRDMLDAGKRAIYSIKTSSYDAFKYLQSLIIVVLLILIEIITLKEKIFGLYNKFISPDKFSSEDKYEYFLISVIFIPTLVAFYKIVESLFEKKPIKILKALFLGIGIYCAVFLIQLIIAITSTKI